MRGDETREELQTKLAERRQRLADFEARGAEALSAFDIQIAFGGDTEMALETSIWFVQNHIAYYSRKIEELGPEQRTLF